LKRNLTLSDEIQSIQLEEIMIKFYHPHLYTSTFSLAAVAFFCTAFFGADVSHAARAEESHPTRHESKGQARTDTVIEGGAAVLPERGCPQLFWLFQRDQVLFVDFSKSMPSGTVAGFEALIASAMQREVADTKVFTLKAFQEVIQTRIFDEIPKEAIPVGSSLRFVRRNLEQITRVGDAKLVGWSATWYDNCSVGNPAARYEKGCIFLTKFSGGDGKFESEPQFYVTKSPIGEELTHQSAYELVKRFAFQEFCGRGTWTNIKLKAPKSELPTQDAKEVSPPEERK
jgi:hypothetical protein